MHRRRIRGRGSGGIPPTPTYRAATIFEQAQIILLMFCHSVYDYTEYELKTRKLKFNAKKPEMLCDGCLQRTPSQALACLFFVWTDISCRKNVQMRSIYRKHFHRKMIILAHDFYEQNTRIKILSHMRGSLK